MTTAQCCIQPQKPFCSFFSLFLDFYYFEVGLLKFTNILFFFFFKFLMLLLLFFPAHFVSGGGVVQASGRLLQHEGGDPVTRL